jgi:hypothetical protein
MTGLGGRELVMSGATPHGPEPEAQTGKAAVSLVPEEIEEVFKENCVNCVPVEAACTPIVAEAPLAPAAFK